MSQFEKLLVVVAIALAAVIAVLVFATSQEPAEAQREPVPNTAANVGKCIQGHRVLWHETRAQAAEACLASLDKVGEQTFSQTWHNFETDLDQW